MSKKSKDKLIEYYKTELARMMSDDDFKRFFGNYPTVVKYSELNEYENINDLLPNDKDFKIILIESKYNSGHWCCVMKYKNIIEYFNSYGTKPEYDFKFIPTRIKHLLGQGGNQLSKLLKTKSPCQQIYYNKKRCQQINDDVSTCGRWCIARILSMKMGYELDDFIQKVDDKCEETGKPSDIIVCDWIK